MVMHGSALQGTALHGRVCHGMRWQGMVRTGSVWYCMVLLVRDILSGSYQSLLVPTTHQYL